ncbi:MAG: Uma2 family endonuclease [Cytophagaceae bacterium]|nr:Uma2 family endonuclease [Gemmatimonadaceae bacterium]
MHATGSMTAEELLHLNLPNRRTELVRGRLIVREPAGYRHGDVAMRLGVLIGTYVYQHKLGRVFAAETGFTLERNPDTVRAPDVAFIRTERLLHPPPRGFAEIAPDLAAEVLSPDDRPGEVLAKVADWLKAGTPLVWVVDPIREHARVYRADGSEALVSPGESLDGEDVLSGFACLVDDVLA